MAKRNRDYSLDHYRLGSSKIVLPKEMLDRMRSLKDLYMRNLPQKYRYYKNFKKLFYDKRTTSTTRALMIDAALHRDAERATDKINLNSKLRNENGRGRYLIDIETDKNGIPRNFAIVFIKSSTLMPKKIKSTPALRKTLRRGYVDPASARLARQALSGKIDKQRGLKIQTAVLEIMKLIMMIKFHLEAIIAIHDKNRKYHLVSPKKEDFKKKTDELEDEKDGYTTEEKMTFFVQNLVEHCNHYLNEGEKFREFYYILYCEKLWDLFAATYRNVRDFGHQHGGKNYDTKTLEHLHAELCSLCIVSLNALMDFSNYILQLNINRKKIYKRVKAMRPSKKIPRAISHATKATWKVDDSKLYIERYSRNMKAVKERLARWKHVR